MGNIFYIVLIQPLLNLLVFFYNYIPDIGVVIVLLTVVIRIILLPAFHRSLKHQKMTQDLQPKMNEIKQKYKDDKVRQNQAMMELWKEHKFNPLGSCLPAIIQLVILIALYQVFITSLGSGNLEGIYSFIDKPEHINTVSLGLIDLAKRNWVMGVIAGVLQFLQTKMMIPKKQPEAKSDDMQTAMMQSMSKQMLYILPVMTVFIGSTWPAGLPLYWIVTTLFGIAQQYYIIRKEAKEALNAAK